MTLWRRRGCAIIRKTRSCEGERMKLAIPAVLLVVLGACDPGGAVTKLAQCERELGGTDARIAQSQAAQAAAERNLLATQQRLAEAEARIASLERARPAETAAAAAPAPAPEPVVLK